MYLSLQNAEIQGGSAEAVVAPQETPKELVVVVWFFDG
jgi:hypothetical protein